MTPRPARNASQSPTLPPAPEQPQSPPPSPSPFFQQPDPAPESSSPEPAPDWSSSPSRSVDAPGSVSLSGTPSTGSDKTPSAPKPPLSKSQLKEITRPAVAEAGEALHELLTRPDSPERALQMWLTDEKDQAMIGDPLAGLAARRIPAGVGGTDTADLIMVAVGVIGYLAKQWGKRQRAQAARREMALMVADQGDGQQAPDSLIRGEAA